MKTSLLTLLGSSLIATGIAVSASPAEAQFRGLRNAVREVDNAARDAREAAETAETVVEAVTGNGRSNGRVSSPRGSSCNANRGSNSNSPCTARAPGHVGVAGEAPARYINQLQCENRGIGNAFVARDGEYTFSQGLSTETRGGLIDRQPVNATNGCFYGGLGIGDVLYVEFNKAGFNRHAYKIQCVSYDGSEQLDHTFGPKVGNYTGKDVMLHTGHSLGYEPTASGSNSSRSGAYDAYLDQRGRAMTTFNFEALHTDRSGTDFFCQWYNNDTGKSAVAFTYRRGPTG